MPKNVFSADNQQERPITKETLFWESSETTRQISQFDKSLAYLLGFLYTDGCLSPKSYNSWRIYFSVKSKELRDSFIKSFLEVFILEPNRVRLGQSSSGYYTVVVNSKTIGTFLVNNFGYFRTLRYPNGSLPRVHLPVKKLIYMDCVRDFLRAAFTCDGGVSFYPVQSGKRSWLNRCVFLACSHPLLRNDYCNLLNSIGIPFTNDPKDKKIRITTRDKIEAFSKEIGFIKGVTATDHSKYWSGSEKNVVLGYLLDSYTNPSKYLEKLR